MKFTIEYNKNEGLRMNGISVKEKAMEFYITAKQKTEKCCATIKETAEGLYRTAKTAYQEAKSEVENRDVKVEGHLEVKVKRVEPKEE